MPAELGRLIAQYHWLQSQDRDGELLSTSKGHKTVAQAMDDVFLDIVSFPATEPRLCYSLIAFLLDVLASDLEGDRVGRAFLRDTALVHVKRLTDRAAKKDAARPSLQ